MDMKKAQSIALEATAFIIENDTLRERLLALTGLDGDDIRTRLSEDAFLASLLEFLLAHEPDLLACAEATNNEPEDLIHAWRALGGGQGQEW